MAASGITPAIAITHGIYTEVDAAAVGKLLVRRETNTLGDCLVFACFAPDGSASGYVRINPTNPPKVKNKPAKYLAPHNAANHIYPPANTRTSPTTRMRAVGKAGM